MTPSDAPTPNTEYPTPNTRRKPKPLWARILPFFASFVPDTDYRQFEIEGIIALHENARSKLRQKAPGVNKSSIKMCSLVLTQERLALYEPTRQIANIRRTDPNFKDITLAQTDDNRLQITLPETAVGETRSTHRGTLTIKMQIPDAALVAAGLSEM